MHYFTSFVSSSSTILIRQCLSIFLNTAAVIQSNLVYLAISYDADQKCNVNCVNDILNGTDVHDVETMLSRYRLTFPCQT